MLCDQVRGVPGVRTRKRACKSPGHHTSPNNETARPHRTLDRLRYFFDEGLGDGEGCDGSEGLGDGGDEGEAGLQKPRSPHQGPIAPLIGSGISLMSSGRRVLLLSLPQTQLCAMI